MSMTDKEIKILADLLETKQWKAAKLMLRNYYPAGKVAVIILFFKAHDLIFQVINFPALCRYHFLKFRIRRQSRRMLRLERKYESLNPGKLSKELPASDLFDKLHNELDRLVKIANSSHNTLSL